MGLTMKKIALLLCMTVLASGLCCGQTLYLDNLLAGQQGGGITFTGTWNTSSGAPYYGDNPGLYAGDAGYPAAAWYRFAPAISNPGVYEVSLWHTVLDYRSSNVLITIGHAEGVNRRYVNMRTNGGCWNLMLAVPFSTNGDAYIEINALNGQACVDGARFVRRPDNNMSPDVWDDFAVVAGGQPSCDIDVLANDFDREGAPLRIASVSTAAHGVVQLHAGTNLTYIPHPGFRGLDRFTYAATDGVFSHTAAVVIRVLGPNETLREVRGCWLNPSAFDSSMAHSQTLDAIAAAGLNTLFILAYPIDVHRGWSIRDHFIAMLEEADARGLNLSPHIWVANRYRALPTVDFRDPAEAMAQQAWVQALLDDLPRLHGVHFDYIRYERDEFGDGCREDTCSAVNGVVANAHALTSARGRKLSAAVFGCYPQTPLTNAYTPTWFQTWRDAGRTVPGGFAFGIDDIPDFLLLQQESPGWLMNGAIDAIMPMLYDDSDYLWDRYVNTFASLLENHGGLSNVCVGLGWYEKTLYAPYMLARKINQARLAGARGFVIFEIGQDHARDATLAAALGRGVFREPAESWLAPAYPRELAVTNMTPWNSGVRLEWQGLASWDYAVQARDDLCATSPWFPVHGQVPGSNGSMQAAIVATNARAVFYRLRVALPQ